MATSKSLAEAVHDAGATPAAPEPETTKGLVLRLPLTLHRDLRRLAIDEDRSLQALGLEAIERLLAERNAARARS